LLTGSIKMQQNI